MLLQGSSKDRLAYVAPGPGLFCRTSCDLLPSLRVDQEPQGAPKHTDRASPCSCTQSQDGSWPEMSHQIGIIWVTVIHLGTGEFRSLGSYGSRPALGSTSALADLCSSWNGTCGLHHLRRMVAIGSPFSLRLLTLGFQDYHFSPPWSLAQHVRKASEVDIPHHL